MFRHAAPFACAAVLLLAGCQSAGTDHPSHRTYSDVDFREEMRSLVVEIADYARTVSIAANPDFIVIPQNGQEILTVSGEADGPVANVYTDAIDGVGREDLYFGYDDDDRATPAGETSYMEEYLDRAESLDIQVLVTDYCTTRSYVDNSYAWNEAAGYISLATDRELDGIPPYPATPYNVHDDPVMTLAAARNFLYLIDPSMYSGGATLTSALATTDYDLFIVDLFDENGTALSAAEVGALQQKPGGARRLAIAYMSIGEAEEYRFYWEAGWDAVPPAWVVEENPDWPGNYKVEYWDPEWKSLIFGSPDAYLDRILTAGFDGVYLDIIDAFEYFEEM